SRRTSRQASTSAITFFRGSRVPTKRKYGRAGWVSTGTSQGAAASGTATTRCGCSRKRSMACFRTASLGVITMVAIPSSNNTGVRRLIRSAAWCQSDLIHGERSCKVRTLGFWGMYGTEKSGPWTTSACRRRASRPSPHSHQRRSAALRGPPPRFRLGAAAAGISNGRSVARKNSSSRKHRARARLSSPVYRASPPLDSVSGAASTSTRMPLPGDSLVFIVPSARPRYHGRSMRFHALAALSLLIASAHAAVPPKLRLDDSIHPLRYAADLTLRPQASTFSGTIDIDIQLVRPTVLIWLNAVDISIRSARLLEARETIVASVERGDSNFSGLRLSAEAPAGAARLHLEYDGKISTRDSAGIFRARDAGENYLFTQFESIDARRAFPCFDQPNFKTPWQLTLHVPHPDTAISNAPQVSETVETGGMKKVVFAVSKPLPTYLIAFAVGPFDIVDAGRAGKNRIPVRIITPKGKAHQAKYAAEVTAAIIDRLEKYFGIPYPYEKSDQVAIPVTYGFGAMENAGMVAYGQTILLSDPALDTP